MPPRSCSYRNNYGLKQPETKDSEQSKPTEWNKSAVVHTLGTSKMKIKPYKPYAVRTLLLAGFHKLLHEDAFSLVVGEEIRPMIWYYTGRFYRIDLP